MTNKTSFGFMEKLCKKPLIEIITFEKEGKPHTHSVHEYCYVLEGSGKVIGSNKERVKKGELCIISPKTKHWMIPKKDKFKLIIWYN